MRLGFADPFFFFLMRRSVKFSLNLLCSPPPIPLLPQAPLLSRTWALWPLQPLQQQVNVVGAGFPDRAAVDGRAGWWRRRCPPSRARLSIVYPPWLSCCPEPGPGPHSCGDALGLLAGTGEREGHRVLTGLRAFWGQRLVGMKPVEVQRALLEAEATPLPGAIVKSLCVVGQITLLGIAIPRH